MRRSHACGGNTRRSRQRAQSVAPQPDQRQSLDRKWLARRLTCTDDAKAKSDTVNRRPRPQRGAPGSNTSGYRDSSNLCALTARHILLELTER